MEFDLDCVYLTQLTRSKPKRHDQPKSTQINLANATGSEHLGCCRFVVCFRMNLLSLDLDLDLDLCIWRMRHAQAAFKENGWA